MIMEIIRIIIALIIAIIKIVIMKVIVIVIMVIMRIIKPKMTIIVIRRTTADTMK